MKLKETLNLGKQIFSMRCSLQPKEPFWQKEWEKQTCNVVRISQGKPQATMHSGPPYANLEISTWTCHEQDFKKILLFVLSLCQDSVHLHVQVWDTHGLPIRQVL